MDWINSQLYMLYDIVDIQKGLDIPTWIVVCVICVCVWGLTMLLLDDKYTSSLYKVISMQMVPRMGNNAPMLMKSKLTPMEFECVPIMSVDELHEMDDKTDASLMKNMS